MSAVPSFRVIAVDMDGTLLADDERILPATYDAIAAARAAGAVLVLASGRPAAGLAHQAVRLGLDLDGLILMGLNGAEATTIAGEVLVESTFAQGCVPVAVAYARSLPVSLMVPRGRDLYVEDPHGYRVQHEADSNGLDVRVVPDLAALDPVHKVLISADPAILVPLVPVIARELVRVADVVASAPFYVEVMPAGVSKGSALRALCERWGIPMSDVVAFGDNHNDRTMIEAAGLGVAMGNAVPQIKAVADLVTTSNNDDGIAAVLTGRLRP